MFTVHEAVARFFPAGADYDHKEADRLITWLESCGYAVVPKSQSAAEPPAPRPKSGTVAPPLAPSTRGAPFLRLVK